VTILSTSDGDTGAEVTATVTLAWALPPAPVQLRVNVDSAASAAVCSEPALAFGPFQPPEAVQSVASELVQLSWAVAPLVTVAGDALSVTLGTG